MSASTRELGSISAVRMIALREIRVRLTSKAYVWTTLAFVAAVVVGGVLLNALAASQGVKHVGVVPTAASVTAPLEATADGIGVDIETTSVDDRSSGEDLLHSGDIDALVTDASPTLEVVVTEELDRVLAPLFASLAQQFALVDSVHALGGDPAEVSARIARAAPDIVALEPAPPVDAGQVAAGTLAGILLFIALVTSGQLVAQGVVEEKTSRVVELLLATIRPWQLMAGKVLGIGIVGLLQVTLVVGAGVATALALGLLDESALDVGSAAVWALVWFVIGFATYALVLAALGALVSRQEDVGSVVGPVTALMAVPYIIGISMASSSPDSPVVVWLSYVPFCAPMIMPIRIALGTAQAWEIALSVGLSLAVIPALVWVAGRVYSNAVLHSGGRMRLTDALRGR